MFDDRSPKKLKNPVNPIGFAGVRKKKIIEPEFLHASISSGDGCARLEQLWNAEGTRGIQYHSPECVSVLSGRAFFLPPKGLDTFISALSCTHGRGCVFNVGIAARRTHCRFSYH